MTLIQRLLNKSKNSADADCRSFNMYHNGDITIEECLIRFYANNRIKNEDQIINIKEFEEWLKSIGYRRNC